jgi:hypothetical protein
MQTICAIEICVSVAHIIVRHGNMVDMPPSKDGRDYVARIPLCAI